MTQTVIEIFVSGNGRKHVFRVAKIEKCPMAKSEDRKLHHFALRPGVYIKCRNRICHVLRSPTIDHDPILTVQDPRAIYNWPLIL